MMPLNYVRFASFDSVDAEDLQGFELLTGPARTLSKGKFVRHEGSPNPEIFRLRSGWLTCCVNTAEGGRQITKIHLPGDLVGMPSMACLQAVETIQAVTDVEIETIPLDVFARIFRDHPRLASLLFLWALEERQFLMNTLTLVGTMRGARRVAALLLHLYRRGIQSEPASGSSIPFPLTQQDVADATGMTVVYANQGLKALRTRGMITWQNGVLTIHDLDQLAAYANLPPEQKRTTNWMSSITR
jgi:CRP/FNR family transcriptional regulator, anaerobic regulatory protein